MKLNAFLKILVRLFILMCFISLLGSCKQKDKCKTLSPVYQTKGVHNSCYCGPDKCIEKRMLTDPSDPKYPEHWVSNWTMFRVFNNYENNLPPYANPPEGLTEGEDYEVSYGTTYFDNGFVPKDGDGYGAMMEHYQKRCLPIFPISNHFTCSFISLGNKAYFLTYEQDRPANMPPCCLFSPLNHPPRTDFIKHLPYSAEDSTHLNNSLQAYRYIAKGPGGAGIWFAYGFFKDQWLDADKKFLKPQSFYFSGSPANPPNAPFVSQNYTDFSIEKPDPEKTWDQVAAMCPSDPPPCHLFKPVTSDNTSDKKSTETIQNTNWSNLNFEGGNSQ
ncbi:MAG: hypothetical protein K0U68_05465 [Gammaproteobacteria bacterium]|nr:hypothetical protein [Gammaproteobacteria bacterium]